MHILNFSIQRISPIAYLGMFNMLPSRGPGQTGAHKKGAPQARERRTAARHFMLCCNIEKFIWCSTGLGEGTCVCRVAKSEICEPEGPTFLQWT